MASARSFLHREMPAKDLAKEYEAIGSPYMLSRRNQT
jgi:hypothetical protein